jgi:bis(5'-nucleosidyl)-tetraphosphatase
MRKKEISYGIIPLRKKHGNWQVLIVKHGKGHWAFPKGHPETGEKPIETAERELREETGLQISNLLDLPQQKERYFFRQGTNLVDKTVIYFVAEVQGEVSIQEREISDFKWLPLKDAKKFVTYKEAKELCTQLTNYMECLTRSRIPGKSSS